MKFFVFFLKASRNDVCQGFRSACQEHFSLMSSSTSMARQFSLQIWLKSVPQILLQRRFLGHVNTIALASYSSRCSKNGQDHMFHFPSTWVTTLNQLVFNTSSYEADLNSSLCRAFEGSSLVVRHMIVLNSRTQEFHVSYV